MPEIWGIWNSSWADLYLLPASRLFLLIMERPNSRTFISLGFIKTVHGPWKHPSVKIKTHDLNENSESCNPTLIEKSWGSMEKSQSCKKRTLLMLMLIWRRHWLMRYRNIRVFYGLHFTGNFPGKPFFPGNFPFPGKAKNPGNWKLYS